MVVVVVVVSGGGSGGGGAVAVLPPRPSPLPPPPAARTSHLLASACTSNAPPSWTDSWSNTCTHVGTLWAQGTPALFHRPKVRRTFRSAAN